MQRETDLPWTDAEDPLPVRYRTLWISDIHLGTPGCQAEALLDFLRHVECQTLFLVGDIIDGWQLRRQWYWPQAHNDVVQKLLRKARKGTRVIFVPGNHDEFARRYLATTSAAWTWWRKPSTPSPTGAACGSRTAISSTAWCSARGGWPCWATWPMSSP